MTEQSLLRRDMSAYRTEEDSTSEQVVEKGVPQAGRVLQVCQKREVGGKDKEKCKSNDLIGKGTRIYSRC